MTPVDQEFIHDPDNGLIGDCQRAVIASLLDLDISEVPHFLKIAMERDGTHGGYWDDLQLWLGARGFAWLEVASGSALWGTREFGVYHEIAGPSPRGNGTWHAVVGCDGVIVFDPHPSRAGLAGDPSEWKFSYLVGLGRKP